MLIIALFRYVFTAEIVGNILEFLMKAMGFMADGTINYIFPALTLFVLAVILGIVLKINFYEWAVIIVAFVVVLAIELLNTAIEAVVDLVTKEIHPLAKIAKDCGSAAAFVSGVASAVICLVIFLPKIIELF